MANKKKLLTTAIALGTAAALTLGGTFAWQSISQTALNEASDIINPGGRLHNDQNWVSAKMNNTDIYVENFTDPDKGGNDIFARVRLSEYMEIVMNYGVDGAEVVDVIAGKKTPTGSYAEDDATRKNEFDYKYAVHYFDSENNTDDWWNWNEGKADSETVYYMPTFNKNKDSLLADLNGTYVDAVGGISNRKAAQYEYEAITAETPAKTAYAIYDGDVNTADEIGRNDLLDLIANGTDAANYEAKKDHIALTSEEHEVAKVGTTKQLISMAEWLEMVGDNYDKATYGSYWVYDTDGWVYWSAPIAAGETTGLLLDSIELKQVMDDTWYYAINVEAQFVTADDVGKDDGTGFYTVLNTVTPAAEDGEETVTEQPITAEAEKLLKLIGVQFDDETAGGEENPDEGNTPDSGEEDDNAIDPPIVIHKDDAAADVRYKAESGKYELTFEGFTGDIDTCVISDDAQYSEISSGDDGWVLNLHSYEPATFTITATDTDGNTGTVTVRPKDTSRRYGVIFSYAQTGAAQGNSGELFGGQGIERSVGNYDLTAKLPRAAKDATLTWTILNSEGQKVTNDEGEITFMDWGANDKYVTMTTDASTTSVGLAVADSAAGKSYTIHVEADKAVPNDRNDGTVTEWDFDFTFKSAAGGDESTGGGQNGPETSNHTLTIEDVVGKEIYDVSDDSNVIVVIDPSYDKTDDDETNLWKIAKKDRVTVYAQKKGSSEVFSSAAVADGGNELTCVYPESNDKWNIFVDLIDEGVTFDNKAFTEYEIWLSVADEEGTTTTSNKLTYKFWSQTATLTQTGATDTVSKEYGTFLAVDGMTMTQVMDGCNADSSFVSNIAVKKDGTDVELVASTATDVDNYYNGTVGDDQVLELAIHYSTNTTGEASDQKDGIIFKPGAAGAYEFTFTINEVQYTSTITVTE